MFCGQCGKMVPEGVKFCPNCGASVVTNTTETNNYAENNGSAGFTQNAGSANNSNCLFIPLNANRSFAEYFLLTAITGGIYGLVFMYGIIKDINTFCAGDGERDYDFWSYFFLTIITCGIYHYYFFYKIGNRLAKNANRYRLATTEDGSSMVMWQLLGLISCGVCALIGMYKFIELVNSFCYSFNQYNLSIRRENN